MPQKFEPLSDKDILRIEAQRKWAREHYDPVSIDRYETIEGKLYLLEGILDSGWINAGETYKLQCLGITFGDILVQQLGMKWMTVEDEIGRDPCIVLEGTSLVFFPLTMISKRIEQGETVDVRRLFSNLRDRFNKFVDRTKVK